MKRILGVACAVLMAGAASAQMPAQAWEPYSAGLVQRAQGGDVAAEFALAEAFRTGNGTSPDREQAIAWYRKAAPADPRASDSLGVLLFTKGERKAAIPLLQAAAGRRNAYALYILGTARFNGDYVPRDIARAYADMRIAAQTLPQAQRSLGMMEPYVGPDDRTRADQFAQAAGGAEAGAPAAPDDALAPPPAATSPIRRVALVTPPPVKKPRKAVVVAPGEALTPAAAAATMPLPPPVAPPLTMTRAAPPSLPDGTPLGTARIDDPAPTPPPVRPKPAVRVPVAKPAVSTESGAATRPTIHPAAAATGAWRIQLGAYGSDERATTQWKALTAKVPALAAYKKATETAGAFVRLQATGLPSKDAASTLCKSVTESGGACFVVPQ